MFKKKNDVLDKQSGFSGEEKQKNASHVNAKPEEANKKKLSLFNKKNADSGEDNKKEEVLTNDTPFLEKANNNSIILSQLLLKIEGNRHALAQLTNELDLLKQKMDDVLEQNAKLSETIDIYRKRDIEQTERINNLERCAKFDENKSLCMELVRLRNILSRKLSSASNEEEQQIYKVLLKHVDVSLSRINVVAFSSNTGDPFDPSKQSALQTIPVDEKKLYGKICSSDEPGYYLEYTLDGKEIKRVISYEKVKVYANKGE